MNDECCTARATLLAARWHSFGAIVLATAIGVGGRILMTHRSAEAVQGLGRAQIYLAALAIECLYFLYARWGARRGVWNVRQILDESRLSPRRWGVYAATAIGAGLVWMACGSVLGLVLRPTPDEVRALMGLLPQGPAEKGLWVLLSMSAGGCEELFYRGYLQRQLCRLTGSLPAAIVLQAVVYGVAHAALPWKIVVMVVCLGVFFGALAAWRKSLIPTMLLHAGFDILGGLMARG